MRETAGTPHAGMMSFLVIEFGLSDQFQALLETISPSTIDRKLKREKERFRLKGMHDRLPSEKPDSGEDLLSPG